MLVSAGFNVVVVPQTAAQQMKSKALPQNKVTMVQTVARPTTFSPDAEHNQLYIGGPKQYQAYRRRRLEEKLTTEELGAAAIAWQKSSAHFYRLGEGSRVCLFALIGSILGFLAGSLTWNPLYLGFVSAKPLVWLPGKFGFGGELLLQLAAFGFLVGAVQRRAASNPAHGPETPVESTLRKILFNRCPKAMRRSESPKQRADRTAKGDHCSPTQKYASQECQKSPRKGEGHSNLNSPARSADPSEPKTKAHTKKGILARTDLPWTRRATANCVKALHPLGKQRKIGTLEIAPRATTRTSHLKARSATERQQQEDRQ